MGVIIFNGIPSTNYGIHVEKPPVYATPERDYEVVHIPGRNGDLVIDNGSWLFTNQPTPELTAKKLRKEAYETEDVIEYDDTVLTVDEANKLYMSYLAEGNNSKCSQLQQLICEAKTTIRNTYPDDKEA